MTEHESEKTRREMLERLKTLRPLSRLEYARKIPEKIPGVDDALYKARILDYQRAPFIERNGIAQAREIAGAVPSEAFPDTSVYLFSCLLRIEAYLFELVRPASAPDDDENRTLMFILGVKKVLKEISGLLPENHATIQKWKRKVLELLEDDLWKAQLGILSDSSRENLTEIISLTGFFHSMSPLEMTNIKTIEELSDKFITACGAPAKKLLNKIPPRNN